MLYKSRVSWMWLLKSGWQFFSLLKRKQNCGYYSIFRYISKHDIALSLESHMGLCILLFW